MHGEGIYTYANGKQEKKKYENGEENEFVIF
jgi:hypothetical protein